MNRPIALVLGDISLVRALGMAGVPVAVAEPRSDHANRSRYVVETVGCPAADPQGNEERLRLAALSDWARRQRWKPVLFYQDDSDLFFVSRYRYSLSENFRFVAPPAQLIESLTQKSTFHFLAERFHFPVPSTIVLSRIPEDRKKQTEQWRLFPAILKPCHRATWKCNPLKELQGGQSKALYFAESTDFWAARDLIVAHGAGALLQQAIPGGEREIVSYHTYIRPNGEVAGHFTGRKLRTYPQRFGHSSHLIATRDLHLQQLGSQILKSLDFHGVAKLDFKRDPRTGQDYLLEINPRFNLWHHLGATLGINLPAMVYRDLTGIEVDSVAVDGFRGQRWMASRRDFRAIASEQPGAEHWAHWALQLMTTEINEDFCLRDPVPALYDLSSAVKRRIAKAVPSEGRLRGALPMNSSFC